MSYAPEVAPRLVELAALAEKRLAAGHDPREVVLAALVAATAPDRGLPPCFDNLTPQMRAVALVLFGGGRTKRAAIAKALGRTADCVQSIINRMVAFQVVRRVGPGLYELNQHTPTLQGLRTIGLPRRVLSYLARVGEASTSTAAGALGRSRCGMSMTLRSLFLAGLIDNPRRGVYRAKTNPMPARSVAP